MSEMAHGIRLIFSPMNSTLGMGLGQRRVLAWTLDVGSQSPRRDYCA